MSDEVERTKCVQRENNASIHQVQLHGRDIKKTSGGGTHFWDGLIFSLSLSLSPGLGETVILPITTIWMKI